MMLAENSDRKKMPTLREYRPATREEILAFTYGQHPLIILNNGRVGTVKINGAVRTWKRDPERIELPVKYGMYEYATLSLPEALSRFVFFVGRGE